jgi:hypothetical protein
VALYFSISSNGSLCINDKPVEFSTSLDKWW